METGPERVRLGWTHTIKMRNSKFEVRKGNSIRIWVDLPVGLITIVANGYWSNSRECTFN